MRARGVHSPLSPSYRKNIKYENPSDEIQYSENSKNSNSRSSGEFRNWFVSENSTFERPLRAVRKAVKYNDEDDFNDHVLNDGDEMDVKVPADENSSRKNFKGEIFDNYSVFKTDKHIFLFRLINHFEMSGQTGSDRVNLQKGLGFLHELVGLSSSLFENADYSKPLSSLESNFSTEEQGIETKKIEPEYQQIKVVQSNQNFAVRPSHHQFIQSVENRYPNEIPTSQFMKINPDFTRMTESSMLSNNSKNTIQIHSYNYGSDSTLSKPDVVAKYSSLNPAQRSFGISTMIESAANRLSENYPNTKNIIRPASSNMAPNSQSPVFLLQPQLHPLFKHNQQNIDALGTNMVSISSTKDHRSEPNVPITYFALPRENQNYAAPTNSPLHSLHAPIAQQSHTLTSSILRIPPFAQMSGESSYPTMNICKEQLTAIDTPEIRERPIKLVPIRDVPTPPDSPSLFFSSFKLMDDKYNGRDTDGKTLNSLHTLHHQNNRILHAD